MTNRYLLLVQEVQRLGNITNPSHRFTSQNGAAVLLDSGFPLAHRPAGLELHRVVG